MSEDVTQITEYNVTYLTKFIEAFNNGYNITEACHYAGVSRMTYYRWVKDNADFAQKCEEAKLMINRKAKEVVVKAVADGDTNAARWWLERRDPDFKNKAHIEVDPDSQALEDKIKEFLDEPDDDYPTNEESDLPDDSSTADAPTDSQA